MTSAKTCGRQSGRQQDTRRTGETQRYLLSCFIFNGTLIVPLRFKAVTVDGGVGS